MHAHVRAALWRRSLLPDSGMGDTSVPCRLRFFHFLLISDTAVSTSSGQSGTVRSAVMQVHVFTP